MVKILIPSQDIDSKVSELADKLRTDYENKNPIFVGALKGSFIFMSDLVRKLNIPVEIDFVQVSSYSAGKVTSGKIKLVKPLKTQIKNRDVLVIEDIIDTGLTLRYLLDYLSRRKPSSLKVCTMFDKRERRLTDVPIDYSGFVVPNVFVVGYGLDYNEQYRCLPDLCIMED